MLAPEQVIRYFLSDLEDIKFYLNLNETWILEELDRYQHYINADDDSEFDRFSGRRNLYASFNNNFPQIARFSQLTYLYGRTEETFNHFCESLYETLSLPIKLTDLKYSGIERAKKYITSLTDIEFHSNTKAWQQINEIRRIRDKIIHTNGVLGDSDQALRNEIDKLTGITIHVAAREKIVLEHGFLDYTVSIIKENFEILDKNYSRAYII